MLTEILRFEIDSRLDYADDDSPFPEVRASVSNIDDPSMPVNTFRVWFLGFILILAATFVATFSCLLHANHFPQGSELLFHIPIPIVRIHR